MWEIDTLAHIKLLLKHLEVDLIIADMHMTEGVYQLGMILDAASFRGKRIFTVSEQTGFDQQLLKDLDGELILKKELQSFLLSYVISENPKHKLEIRLPEKTKEHFYLDLNERAIYANGKLIYLTSKERDIFEVLLKAVNQTVMREHLLYVISNEQKKLAEREVDVFISRIRRKLKDAEVEAFFIETIRQKGYCLRLKERFENNPL